ncbi:hypothetical protein LY13_004423 [Prauserella aidingensis]|nr:hypothetical protein [Prauserella aidingensis]
MAGTDTSGQTAEHGQSFWGDLGEAVTGKAAAGSTVRVGAGVTDTWSGVNFIVDGQETNPGTGGGFRLDRDEAIQLQKKATALAEHYSGLTRTTEQLKHMGTPADVQPCNAFTQAMTQSWSAGHSNTEQLRDLWKNLAEKLAKMVGTYEEQDEQSGKDVKQSGGQDSGGGYLG